MTPEPNLTRLQWVALYLAVVTAAGATLALQLVQTRVLSALYYNHLVYLTVTVALLGFGISGVVVAIAAPRVKRLEEIAAAGLCGFSLFIPISLGSASYLPVIFVTPAILLKLTLSYFLLVIPFIFAGATLASIFMSGGRNMQRLYFADLTASALGTLAFVFFLTPLGGEGMVWACSFAAMFGFLTLTIAFHGGIIRLVLAVSLLTFLFLEFHGKLINETPDFYKIGRLVEECRDVRPASTRWTTISKIDVMTSPDFLMQLSPKYPPLPFWELTQDRDAPTLILPKNLYNVRMNLAQGSPPQILGEAISFVAHPNPVDSLIIGVGGGADIIDAEAFHAQHITGIEINPQTASLLQHEYADYAVWPKLSNVDLQCLDGRNYVAGTSKRFDTITLAGIDTFAALSTGAYVLSENYLYTVEAIRNYLRVLKPNGILNIYRWNFSVPRESLRLCNLFLEAAAEAHNPHPDQCVMIVGFDNGVNSEMRWAATLMKNEPFTRDEVDRMLAQIDRQPPLALIYLPKIYSPEKQRELEDKYFKYDPQYYARNRTAFSSLIDAKSREERTQFEDSYPYNITPVYDNRPFFFEYHKITEIFHSFHDPNDMNVRGVYVHYTLYFLLLITSVISYLGMIVPLHFYAREGLLVPAAKALILYFSSLGLGFMFVELGVIQTLNIYLGHPMYSLALVLAGLLFFTGVGSYISGRRRVSSIHLIKQGMVGSCIVIVLWMLLMPLVISSTIGTSIWLRGALALVSLFPLGLLMGIPFSTGIRCLSDSQARFVPWAWGINGLTSVMASILAILLAMRIGFKSVLILGALSYLVGYLASKRFIKN